MRVATEERQELGDYLDRMALREGARKILKDYADPPEGGTVVPRAWVEENMLSVVIAADLDAEFEAQADRAVSEMIGDIGNWKPTGIVNVLPPDGTR